MAVTVASAMIRLPAEPLSTCGSAFSSTTSRTVPPASATERSGETSRSIPRTAAAVVPTVSPARTARATAAARPFDRRATAAATPIAVTAPRASCVGVNSGAAALTAQRAAATGARRRSTQSQRPAANGSGGPEGAHADTSSASSAAMEGPMPGTSSSSSTALKGPCRVRWSTIRWARTGPMPGNASSSPAVAVLRSMRLRRLASWPRPRRRPAPHPRPERPRRSAPRP